MSTPFKTLANATEFNEITRAEEAVLVYFSHEQCNVCKVLKPKIDALIKTNFPNIKTYYADTKNAPDIAGQAGIFAVPSIVVFFAGREYIRKSRNIGIGELAELIDRQYSMLFS